MSLRKNFKPAAALNQAYKNASHQKEPDPSRETLFSKGTAGSKTEEAPAVGNYTKFNYNGAPLPPGVERQGHA